MANKLYVKQINLHHCKDAVALIDRDLHNMQTNKQNLIILIQEPWINSNVVKGLDENKYNLYYNRHGNRPRACIVTTKGLKAVLMPQFSSDDSATILVNIDQNETSEELIFSSVYMDYTRNDQIPELIVQNTISHSTNSGIPIIIGADCNAHHTLWGSSDINERGRKLAEFLVTTDLGICNKGTTPTFVNKIRSEVLDITLATQHFVDRIKEWYVSEEVSLSDHREINFFLEHTKNPDVLYVPGIQTVNSLIIC